MIQYLIKLFTKNFKEERKEANKISSNLPVSRSYFPEGIWVKAKRSGGKRYVTRQTNKECFEDDGKVSGQAASPYCHYDNYEAL